MEKISNNCEQYFVQTVLKIVNIDSQNAFFFKYVIVQVELNIV